MCVCVWDDLCTIDMNYMWAILSWYTWGVCVINLNEIWYLNLYVVFKVNDVWYLNIQDGKCWLRYMLKDMWLLWPRESDECYMHYENLMNYITVHEYVPYDDR